MNPSNTIPANESQGNKSPGNIGSTSKLNAVKPIIALLLTSFLAVACSSSPPAPTREPYNDADSQRTRSDDAQREMSKETR